MPWGTTKKQLSKRAKLHAQLSAINKKAKQLHNNAIKVLSTPKRSKYHGIFFYIYLNRYCKQKKLTEILVILLMMVDFYQVFDYKYIQLWGLGQRDDEVTYWIRQLRKDGFIIKDQIHRAHFYLSLKGTNIVNEFYDFYEKERKEQLKKNADGHKKLVVYFSRADLQRNKQDNIAKGIKHIPYRGWKPTGEPYKRPIVERSPKNTGQNT